MTRLSIELTSQQHNAIKAMALLEGMNMKEFVVNRVFDQPLKPYKPKTQQKTKRKQPNNRLMAALEESFNLKGKKRYHSAKDFFDQYR